MLLHTFPVSGVETWLWLPPLVAFGISFFTSMVGISGAFLLLPFQVSVLGFASPAVSATNLVYNLVATPGGVWRYLREGRMVWPLVWIVVAGTLPGVAVGYWLRLAYFRDVAAFKLFVGAVLLYLGWRLARETLAGRRTAGFATMPAGGEVSLRSVSRSRVELDFAGERYGFDTRGMFLLAVAVGVVGGIYGIGGGAIIAPFCVAIFGLPVYIVAGAALAGTLVTSLAGVALYMFAPAPAGVAVRPDWALGLLFGLGGLAGMYAGARFQKRVPQSVLKGTLAVLLLVMALGYIF